MMRSVFDKLHPTIINLLTSTTLMLVGMRGFNSPAASACSFIVDVVVFLITFVKAEGCGTGPVLVVVTYNVTKLLLCWLLK